MDALDWSRLPVDPLFRFYMEQFFSNPAPQRVDEEKLVELVAIRTRNLADEIRGYSDLTIEEAMNEDEHHIIELLNGLRELVYNHNDPQLRTGRVFADFTAQVIMFCLLFAHRVICSSEDTPTQKAEKIRSYAYNDVADGEALLPFRNLMVYLRDHAGDGMFIGQWVDECIAFLSFVQMTDQQWLAISDTSSNTASAKLWRCCRRWKGWTARRLPYRNRSRDKVYLPRRNQKNHHAAPSERAIQEWRMGCQ